jgi:hypothetical protein
MGLIAHWPLTGDLNDVSGNNNHLVYYNNNGKLNVNNNGKIGECYNRAVLNDGTDYLRSTNTVDITNDFTLMLWAYITDTHHDTANGLMTNHNHVTNQGAGITVKSLVNDSDYRISCNTGSGTGRRYHTYYGTSNIRNKWSHLTMRFKRATKQIPLRQNRCQT